MVAGVSRFAVLAVLMLASGCGALTTKDQTSVKDEVVTTAEVEWVIDGDTVDLIIDGQQERVRLIGIDTPESVSRDVPVQCYGQEAAEALKGLLPVGSMVRVERDQEPRDRFGRLLLYLYRAEDDLFVNAALIEGGFADTLFFEPNMAFVGEFTRLRNAARDNAVGLWGTCDGPDQPLE